MKVFETNKLCHTLQTYLGMVTNQGEPRQRRLTYLPRLLADNKPIFVLTCAPCFLSEEYLLSLFTCCVLECRLPQFFDSCQFKEDVKRFESNIDACLDTYDINFMKKNIVALNRLDMEQAAAIVISTVKTDAEIPNRAEIVEGLIQGLDPTLITKSCMWLESHQMNSGDTVEEDKFSGLCQFFRRISRKDHGDVDDWSSLLSLLLRVRRCHPRARCLFIPQWIFDAAGMEPPSHFAIWDSHGRVSPGKEPITTEIPSENDIVLGRKAFRSFQRRLLSYYRFWVPEYHLRKQIAVLEAGVIYSADAIKSKVLPSQDTLYVAYYFFAFQRRLQRKVVSDLDWTGFLEKGESGNVFQNNPDIPSTFEERLCKFSGQNSLPVSGPILPQIDRCCLLMEEYVAVYGGRDCNKLVFSPGQIGGSGRGAVDDYNLLCDVLKTLRKAAKEQGQAYPGPVRKFLAKDIMAWNNSFADDAFANGRVPGWKTWLAERKEAGLLGSMERLKIDEDGN